MQEKNESIELYKKLIANSSSEILEFLKNVPFFENTLKFDNFNEQCYFIMFKNNDKNSPRQSFFNIIPTLEGECSKCWKFFLNQRNKSIKGLDVQLGKKFENSFENFLKTQGLNVERGDKENKRYPDYVILNDNGKIIAYYELKYHQAPFVFTHKKRPGRECYEGSITLDHKKIENQIDLIKNEIGVPVFFVHWVDFPCIKGIFCQSSTDVEEIIKGGIEYNRDEREGDFAKGRKVGYTEKFYPSLLKMIEFSEFLKIIKNLK